MIRLRLKPGRDESVRRRHPWLFSGAVASREGDGSDGKAEVVDARGELLARGAFSPDSQIIARLWTFDGQPVDAELFQRRFLAARALRERFVSAGTTGYRLVNSEGDRCPGLLIDRYGDVAVLDLLTGGTAMWEEELASATRSVFAPARLVIRSSAAAQDDRRRDSSRETRASESDLVWFSENNLKLVADVALGQKTGFFLDQRDNRSRLQTLARGRTVLNLFSYSGAFSVAALAGGAFRAVDVDSSEAALALARRQRETNGLPADDSDFVRADVFEDLRSRVERQEQWDVVICDPPAFAKKRSDVERAARGYKDVNRLAMTLVASGGLLLTCSCSGLVSADLFQKIVFSASRDAGIPFSMVGRAGAGPDHPVSLDCPEGEYLKGMWLRRAEN
jgi:23S rRNA (cytosine1962-C5)-methyltransferase